MPIAAVCFSLPKLFLIYNSIELCYICKVLNVKFFSPTPVDFEILQYENTSYPSLLFIKLFFHFKCTVCYYS